MDFKWAIKQMENKKKVRRLKWILEFGQHIHVYKSEDYIQDEKGNEFPMGFLNLNATDWELFEEPKETLSDKITSRTLGAQQFYHEEDIKEFIKKLKKNLGKDGEYTEEYNLRIINEFAGPRFK